MDPITLAITTALGSLGAQLIQDAYNAFKAALQQKYGVNSDLIDAVNQAEKRPDSPARQGLLQEEVQRSGVDKDPEVVAAAQRLLELVQASQLTTSGSGPVVNISGGTVQGFIQENKGQVSINFGEAPSQK